MNTKLISKAAALDHFDRDAAIKRYVQLLEQPTHSDAEVSEFNSLLKQLGKSPADASADVVVMQKARRLADRIEAFRGRSDEGDGFGVRIQQHQAAKVAWLAKWRAELVAIEAEQEAHHAAFRSASMAVIDLRELRVGNGHLLPSIVPPTDAEFHAITTDKKGRKSPQKPADTTGV